MANQMASDSEVEIPLIFCGRKPERTTAIFLRESAKLALSLH